MEIQKLVLVSGFAVHVNRLQESQYSKTCEAWSVNHGAERKVDPFLQLSD